VSRLAVQASWGAQTLGRFELRAVNARHNPVHIQTAPIKQKRNQQSAISTRY
jgi:hypothetical protein